jgi:hypothetical protein
LDVLHFWKFLIGFCAFLEVLHGIFGSSSWDFVHMLEVPYEILYIFGSSSLNFVHFWKFFMGFVEVSHRIFGSSSWHFVHILEVPYEILYIFWKFLIGFCAFLEVLHRICGSFSWDSWKFLMGFCAYLRVPHGIVYILELPRGILCIIGRSSWDFVHILSWDFVYFWKFLMGFCVFLEVPHGILCIFGSSSWDVVHFWKFLMDKRTHVHFTLSLFLYKIRVFATSILIGCGFRWLQNVIL